jgi:predicted PurR-regulated permease PerM
MPSKGKTIFTLAVIAVIVLLIIFVYYFRGKIGDVMVPFFMAVVIAYLLNPLVKRLEAKNIPCTASILIIYLGFLLIIIVSLVFVIPEVVNNARDLITILPEITEEYQNFFNNTLSFIQSSNWPPDLKNAIFSQIQESIGVAQNYIADVLKRTLTGILQIAFAFMDFILALIIAYYFIKDAKFFKESALSLVPRKWRNGLINTGRDISFILSNFIQGQLLTALIVGTLETLGLIIVGVKYPLVLGMLGGLANIIPYFGPVIGAIPSIAVALLDSPLRAFWTVLMFVAIQQIDNAFISPKIIEGRLGLHPVTTILAVLVGQKFFGILGMMLSVPIVAMLKVIIKRAIEAIV